MPEAPSEARVLRAQVEDAVGGLALEVAPGPDGIVTVALPAGALREACRLLRDDERLAFDFLTDICSVDHAGSRTPRFTVVYHLYSVRHNRRLRLKVGVPQEAPEVDSVASIWSTANWHERELYDMMGIRARHHPDLRRILMPLEYEWHPLRKDFPLEGIDPGKLYREDRGDT